MFLPPTTKTHWVYDDPSGVPEPEPETFAAEAKVIPLPLRPIRPVPASPKAA